MNSSLLDTDVLSLYFRNNPNVVSRFQKYLDQYEIINFSIITYYEILSGLKHRDALKQLVSFQDFSKGGGDRDGDLFARGKIDSRLYRVL